MWFAPVYLFNHWWLYLLHRGTKNLWVLDSIHDSPNHKRRKKVDEYVGVLLKEMAAAVDPALEFSGNKNDGVFDCGIYVIKWMEMFDPDKMGMDGPLMPTWDNKRIGYGHAFCKDNVVRNLAEDVLQQSKGRKNERGKKKELKRSLD
ncbi:hypothetical protein PIB30_046790 [Stylosanthes scabra]|uniref:Ubiquitin-like protease family profile domain-containing protein n=1 Tax=Stylosanthes scabra TaxID=79078 RepID=A0ABU6ZFB1_9FABA|nr:hypothetical protein [Stylosanthes scabra]